MQRETPKGTLTLRPITMADIPAYRALRLEALERHPEVYGGTYEHTAGRSDADWREWMDRNQAGERQAFYVAAAGGELIACTGIFRAEGAKMEHTATIFGVYVRPVWRGLRITDDLIGLCLDWARSTGLYQARLAAVTTNGSAIRCYARCGFTVYGVEPAAIRYDGRYYDELLMVRRV